MWRFVIKNSLNYLDLFSGIGGFAYGAHLAGFKCENHLFSEIDKYCVELYQKRFPDAIALGDITKINGNYLKTWCGLVDSVKTLYNPINQDDWSNNMAGKLKKLTEQQVLESISMYQKGLSLGAVAEYFCVSRQAMWDLLRRRIKLRGNKKYGLENHFYRGGKRAEDNAQNMLEYAIRKKIIERKNICEHCGDSGFMVDGRNKVQAHHCDYNKPLDVMWLCQKCHHEWHKKNKPKQKEKNEKPVGDFIITGGFP